jgi:hypothetical protein
LRIAEMNRDIAAQQLRVAEAQRDAAQSTVGWARVQGVATGVATVIALGTLLIAAFH